MRLCVSRRLFIYLWVNSSVVYCSGGQRGGGALFQPVDQAGQDNVRGGEEQGEGDYGRDVCQVLWVSVFCRCFFLVSVFF